MNMSLLIFFMFDRFRKKITETVTNDTVDTVKKTFNDRIEDYGDIIEIGLVLMVIILGGKHLTKRSAEKRQTYEGYYSPSSTLRLPNGNGQPIIINNYYTREREEEQSYVRHKEEKNGSRKNNQVR